MRSIYKACIYLFIQNSHFTVFGGIQCFKVNNNITARTSEHEEIAAHFIIIFFLLCAGYLFVASDSIVNGG